MSTSRIPAPRISSRREFLQKVSTGLAAGLVLKGLPAAGLAQEAAGLAQEDVWKLRLSTSSIHYLHLPIEQACQRIAKLGYEAIDIWSAHAGCPHLDDVAKRLGAEGLKQVLEANRLKLFAFSVYAGGYPKYAELLGQMGGGVAIQGSAGPCAPAELTTRMRSFLESLKPQVELAEKYNSYLAIENHGHALLDSLDSFKAFVELNRSPRLGLALAPYHLQAAKVSVEDTIGVCGQQLFFFYAWQLADGAQQLPGHGPTDFKPWVAALAKAKYRWYVNPFMHGDIEPDAMSEALAKSREYLQRG
ncbi:MAG: sugar phosphate isomerase/epimerase [Planctomycetota bacterium]|nr:sugar phosphate isomerase/epimerase [Planctomycetota bacterium]